MNFELLDQLVNLLVFQVLKAGDGSSTSDTITVTTTEAVTGLDVDTPFVLSGITAAGYNGKFVVSEKLSSTQFKYEVQNAPVNLFQL